MEVSMVVSSAEFAAAAALEKTFYPVKAFYAMFLHGTERGNGRDAGQSAFPWDKMLFM